MIEALVGFPLLAGLAGVLAALFDRWVRWPVCPAVAGLCFVAYIAPNYRPFARGLGEAWSVVIVVFLITGYLITIASKQSSKKE